MPFVPALPTGSGVEARHLAYTAELVNTTNANLRVEYTIRLPGASPTAATVSYAELTATSEPINFRGGAARVGQPRRAPARLVTDRTSPSLSLIAAPASLAHRQLDDHYQPGRLPGAGRIHLC
jgi:hypothetical protein